MNASKHKILTTILAAVILIGCQLVDPATDPGSSGSTDSALTPLELARKSQADSLVKFRVYRDSHGSAGNRHS